MNSTAKKNIIIILAVAIAASLIGFFAFSLGLGDILPKEGLVASLIGRTPMRFAMNCCLISVLVMIFAVPSFREVFMGSLASASNYSDSRSRGKRNNRI